MRGCVVGSEGTASWLQWVPPVLSLPLPYKGDAKTCTGDVAVPTPAVSCSLSRGCLKGDGDIRAERHQPSPSITCRQACVPSGVTGVIDAPSVWKGMDLPVLPSHQPPALLQSSCRRASFATGEAL